MTLRSMPRDGSRSHIANHGGKGYMCSLSTSESEGRQQKCLIQNAALHSTALHWMSGIPAVCL